MRKSRWKLDIHPSLHIIFCVLTEVGTSCRFGPFDKKSYTPENYRKLTCPLKRGYFSREYIFEPSILRGHVSFQGSRVDSPHPAMLPGAQSSSRATKPCGSEAQTRLLISYHIISYQIILYIIIIALYYILFYYMILDHIL